MINTDYMKLAIEAAQRANNEIPVGAVIVRNDEIIAVTCNEKETQNIATKHAEIIAIEQASKKLNNWRLEDCSLYVTLEPCPMCAWAIIQSRIKNVYFGSYDTLYGALGSKIDLRQLLNNNLNVKGGLLEEDCNILLKNYFEQIREK